MEKGFLMRDTIDRIQEDWLNWQRRQIQWLLSFPWVQCMLAQLSRIGTKWGLMDSPWCQRKDGGRVLGRVCLAFAVCCGLFYIVSSGLRIWIRIDPNGLLFAVFGYGTVLQILSNLVSCILGGNNLFPAMTYLSNTETLPEYTVVIWYYHSLQ